MNPREKGRRREIQAEKELKEAGWNVLLTKMGNRISRCNDFFGLFDLMAVKKVRGVTKYKWIQVKSNYCPKKVREKIKEFSDKNFDKNNSAEVWVFKDYKGWKIHII